MPEPELTAALDNARAATDTAIARSGAVVRTTDRLSDLEDIFALYREIWSPAPDSLSLSVSMLRALGKAGGYIAGAWDESGLVGMTIGMNSTPGHRHLHSHIAGVRADRQGRGLGEALKQHQRLWALEHGIIGISWTFDPLVGRNAHFNIAKLGALPAEYLPDFYGPMGDAVNVGEATDRILAEWDLVAERGSASIPIGTPLIIVGSDGSPALRKDRVDGDTVSILVPSDILQLRLRDPALAAAWRHAVRDAFLCEFDRGARVRGFDRRAGYLLSRPPARFVPSALEGDHQ